MTRIERSAAWQGLAAQILVAAGGLGLLALFPADGAPVLVVPLTAAAARALPALAIDGSAPVLAAGPWPGSIVLAGRPRRGWAMLRHGIVAVTAPAAICGSLPGAAG